MIKIQEIKKEIKDKIMVGIECDICHKEYPNKTSEDEMEIQEFHHVRLRGGYGSVFGDDFEVECDICQYCLKDLIGKYCRIS